LTIETLARGEDFEKNEAEPWRDMEFLIFTNSATWNNFLDERCREDLMSKLKNFTNFGDYFLIVALQGSKPSDGYSINITNVTQFDKTVKVKVHLVEAEMGIDVVTSPYHIIKVKKKDMTERGNIKFVFIDDVNEEILSEVEYIIN